ncbi:IS5 family transposase, partial [Desulfovibrio inopinatus]
ADCSKALSLIQGINALFLIADKGYDTQKIVDEALRRNMTPVIPPRRNRKEQRKYDKYIYKLRHLVENAFLYIKQWRGIATRYAKMTTSFLAAVQIRCLFWWLTIS